MNMEIQNIDSEILGFLGLGLGSFLAANILFFIIFIILLFLLPYVFFLIHLSKLFNRCDVKNKKMDGGLVWLLLIPLFNIGWLFYVIIKLVTFLKYRTDIHSKRSWICTT